MKIGIIGCGIITQEAHVPALLRLKDKIEVVALCNHSEPKALKTRELLGNPDIAIYSDWESMIDERKDLDAVLIALPIIYNYEVSKYCQDAGLPVFCEKPAGRDAKEAEKSLDFVASEKPFYMIAEDFEYKPGLHKAKELIDSGKIGRLHSIQTNMLCHLPVDNKFNKTTWRCNNEHVGGYLLDGGVHHVHAVQFIAGRINSVYGKVRSINPLLGTTDLGFAIFEHDSGVITSFNMGWQHSDNTGEYMRIYGTEGTLIVKDDSIILLDKFGNETPVEFEREDLFYLEWIDFYEAYHGRKIPEVTQVKAVHDVRVVNAIVTSSNTGMQISL